MTENCCKKCIWYDHWECHDEESQTNPLNHTCPAFVLSISPEAEDYND